MIYSYIDLILESNNYHSRKFLDIELIKHYYDNNKGVSSTITNIDDRNIKVKFIIKSKSDTNEDVILALSSMEINDITQLVNSLKNMKLVTTHKNIILFNAPNIYKHEEYDIWYTNYNTNISNVLFRLRGYIQNNIFTIRKVKHMDFFKEFYESFNYSTYYENSEFISIKSNDPFFYPDWLLNSDHYKYLLNGKIYNNIPLCYIYYFDNTLSISKIYAGFLFSYIKNVQRTLLANYEYYLSVDIVNNNDRYVVRFRVPNIEIFNKIIRNFIQPSKFQEKSFENKNQALLFREALSKQNIRSIIFKELTVVWLSDVKDVQVLESSLYKNLYENLIKISSRDDLSFEDFEGIELSELYEVVNLGSYACRHTSLIGITKDPFTRKNFTNMKRSKFGHLYRGFETINGLLGVIDEIKNINEIKLNEGKIVEIAKQEFDGTHFIYDFMLMYDGGFIGDNILSLMLKEEDLKKIMELLQKVWNKGSFLKVWEACWTHKNNKLSILCDILSYEPHDIVESEDFILQLGYI